MNKLYQVMDDLNVRTQKLLEIQKAQIPIGDTLQLTVNPVTQEATIINKYYIMPDGSLWYGPWIKFDLFNDGPSPVFFVVNNEMGRQAYASLNVHEMLVEDRKVPAINSLTLFTATGGTASVRVFFKR
jgi:hypothetical protein